MIKSDFPDTWTDRVYITYLRTDLHVSVPRPKDTQFGSFFADKCRYKRLYLVKGYR